MTDQADDGVTDSGVVEVASPRPRVPLDFRRDSPEGMLARAREYEDTLTRRRTVRDFSTDPIPLEVLAHAIRTASSAPSGAHQQPWTFVVVTDHEIKARIREAAEVEERTNWGGRMSKEWISALEPLGLDWQKPHLTDAPALIIVFAQTWGREVGPDGAVHRRKHYYVDESVGIAVGFLLSALHIAGLATLTHTPSPMGFLRRILNRPDNERAFVVIPVGYPSANATVPAIARKSLDEVCVFVGERG